MDRSTSKETATKIVNTVATDHVGVKAKDRISCIFSAILSNLTHRPQTLPQIQPPKITTLHYNLSRISSNEQLTIQNPRP